MRVHELNEDDTVKKAVFTFGRLNPPHFGHGGMIDTLQKVAKEQNADWYLFVSSKTGDEKNPLTYEQKVWWIQTLFPETKGHLVIDPSIKTPLVAATWLYKQGYRAGTFVAGEDDMPTYGEMIKSGNNHGIKNPDAVKAGKGFVFNPLNFAISPRLASATNARKNITDGDPEAFVRSILGPKINPKLAELVHDQLYPTLRKAMGLGESVGENQKLSEIESLSDFGKSSSQREITSEVLLQTRNKTPKLIGSFGQFSVMSVKYGTYGLFVYVYDKVNKKPAGYSFLSLDGKAYHPDITRISSAYQGNRIGLEAYKVLIKKGMMLRSGHQQSVGGQKLWNELSDTPGILVYAAKPKGRKKFEYSLVEPGDAGRVLADFDVYTKSDKEVEAIEKKVIDHLEAITSVSNGKIKRTYKDGKDTLEIKPGANPAQVKQAQNLIAQLNQLGKDFAETEPVFLVAVASKGTKVKENKLLNKRTPSVTDLAKKYVTSASEVQRKLAKGIKVEFEHSSDIEVAREIALDHLGERLDYYDLLDKVEQTAKKKTEESWSNKYKKSINCASPKGFSQRAHCAGRKARQSGKQTKSKSVSENFADGKGPGRPGDSQRHGIPKGATIAQLEKHAKRPGRAGQLARWQLNMRRGKTNEDVEIDEASMSAGALADFAKSDFAQSLTVGFEAEMIFPNIDEPEIDRTRPDLTRDEDFPIESGWKNTLRDFFLSGDVPNEGRSVERVIDDIAETYSDWVYAGFQDWLDTKEAKELAEKHNLNYKLATDKNVDDNDDDKYKAQYLIQARYSRQLSTFKTFLEEEGLTTMSEVWNKYRRYIDWPYPDESSVTSGPKGLANSLAKSINVKTIYNKAYHGATRDNETWIFEPDTSIRPSEGGVGIEVVSPPMPFQEAMNKLDQFLNWARDQDAYTNNSTGFHVGVSIPNQTMENIDHLKLVLFLGDQYVLADFGRAANKYAESFYGKITDFLNYSNSEIAPLLDKLRQGMQSLAFTELRKQLVNTQKGDRYVSVNIKDNYIEFRSAGGDYAADKDKIKNTILRYVRAMGIAADPEAYKQEYAKKTYQLLSSLIKPGATAQITQAFNMYVVGAINKAELKRRLLKLRSRRNIEQGKIPGEGPDGPGNYVVSYKLGSNTQQKKIRADSRADAFRRILNVVGNSAEIIKVDRIIKNTFKVTYKNEVAYIEANDVADAIAKARTYTYFGTGSAPADSEFQVQLHTQESVNPVNEVADQPYRFLQAKKTATSNVYIFMNDAGSRFVVEVEYSPNSEMIEIGFADHSDKENPTIGLTGKGDAFRIFATVVAIVKEYMSKSTKPVNQITFKGKVKDPSRIKLYDAIARYLPKVLPGFELMGSGADSEEKQYFFKKTSVSEANNFSAWKIYSVENGKYKYHGQTKDKLEAQKIIDRRKRKDKIAGVNREWILSLPYLEETLKKVNGKWALVSRHDPKKVLQYYKGSGHPSKEWVSKVERRVHSFSEAIDDNWFKDGFQTYKQPMPVKYETADTDGVLQTLEGPVKYKAGYKIMTGPKGEQYPIPPEKFAELYDVAKDGTATPKKIIKVAKLADHDGVVNTSWGEPLNYTAGNDYIVRHGANDYGVVKKDIFAKTYIKEDEDTVKPRVYLDMDGVLADFFGEWSRISGVDHYKDIDDVEAKLQLVREHPTFWIDLPLLPNAKALIKTVVEQYGEYRICSKPLEGDPRSKPGKLEWIRKHLSDMPPVEIILTADKAQYATNDGLPNVLVDDYGKNISAWRDAGGIGIQYEHGSFPRVSKVLKSIAKSGVSK